VAGLLARGILRYRLRAADGRKKGLELSAEPRDECVETRSEVFEPDERHDAMCRIDALVAQEVFQLNAEELAFVLDSFEAVKRTEIASTGEYRTKLRILHYYEQCG
jgi:hypothetical protein